MTDLEKMAAGELYWGFNPVFVPALERGQDYCHRYNLLPPSEKAARNNLLKEFFEKRRIKNPLKREMIEMKVYNFLLKGENTPQERYNLFH